MPMLPRAMSPPGVRGVSTKVCRAFAGFVVAVAPSFAQQDAMAKATRLLEANDLAAAIATLDRALEVHRDSAELWWLRSLCKGRSGDLDGGIADASRAIELAPKDARGWCERGYLRKQKGQFDEALRDFDRAIELAPGVASLWGDRGDTKSERGDLLEAVADYDKALELEPDFGPALHNRACVFMGLGAWQTAVRDQKRAIRLTPPMARMYLILADAQMRVGLLDDAIASCKRASAIGGEPEHEVRQRLAEAHWLCGRGDAATDELAAAVAAPGTPPAAVPMLEQRLGAYLIVLGKDESALAHLERAAGAPELRPWVALMRWCAAADSARGAAELQAAFAAISPPPDPQEAALVRICTGTSTAEREVQAGLPSSLQCAAWFFAGWRDRRDGKAEAAASCFRRSIATGREDAIQWRLAHGALGLGQQKQRPGHFGCSVRAVPDAATPTLEVVAVDGGGPAEVQGVRVGMRLSFVNEQPASESSFAAACASAVVGTPVRLLVVDGEVARPLWVVAGIKEP